ncbi:uncharacterized protein G2W53_020831 [Senna tora]|uniref:Uncharacterized protein n=1 Tax=Senna tora TaxID=362788 RepID=A0A834TI91_9FABA|nr:uncharacterized protein G2W53_020831 [Senna tora]
MVYYTVANQRFKRRIEFNSNNDGRRLKDGQAI